MKGFIDKRSLKVILVGIIGVAVVVGAIKVLHIRKKTILNAAAVVNTSDPSRIPRVQVQSVKSGAIARVLELPGSLRSYYKAKLYAKASGYIQKVLADIGDRVKAGQLLAVIEEPELQKQLAQAQASLAAAAAGITQAQAQLEQYQRGLGVAKGNLTSAQASLTLQEAIYASSKQLFHGQAISQQAFDQATSQLTGAQAGVDVARAKEAAAEALIQSGRSALVLSQANEQVAQARMQKFQTLLAYDRITAPFAGVITMRGIDPGDFVQSAAQGKSIKPLFQIVQQKQVRVFVDVPEQDVRFVHVGTPAEVTPFGYANLHLRGAITRTADTLDDATRTLRCEIDLENPTGILRGGMYANVKIFEQRGHGVVVPQTSLIHSGDKTYVMLVQHNRTVEIPVKTGISTSLMVQITSGLQVGQQLIVRGQNFVQVGGEVVPIARAQGSAASGINPKTDAAGFAN
ncbi:MAG: efflux RND transporter periplasmic adaptor subunit [Phycisphaerae bacterium]